MLVKALHIDLQLPVGCRATPKQSATCIYMPCQIMYTCGEMSRTFLRMTDGGHRCGLQQASVSHDMISCCVYVPGHWYKWQILALQMSEKAASPFKVTIAMGLHNCGGGYPCSSMFSEEMDHGGRQHVAQEAQIGEA